MRKIVIILFAWTGWLVLWLVSAIGVKAQDLHYSQFYNSPQNINPALAGNFQGTARYMMSIRDQWRFVPVPWFTTSLAYDTKYYIKGADRIMLGWGVNVNHDRQGDSKMNLTTLNGQLAMHYLVSQKHILSSGLTLGLASRGFDTRSLTWDKQWDGEVFNGSLPSGEAFGNLERINFLETGFGANYNYQHSDRTYVNLGGSILHLLPPNQAFYDGVEADLPRRYSLSFISQVKLLSAVDIQLHALQQYQGVYEETIGGALIKFHLSQARGKMFQFHAGLAYRTSESMIPTMAIHYNNYYVGFSYDIDTNAYNDIVGSNKGGPEVHFRYIFAKVASLKNAKVCPIY